MAGRQRTSVLLALLCAACSVHGAGPWQDLSDDGLHDPAGPGIGVLQQPAEALSVLPQDGAGNHVHWVKALRDGFITPRHALADKPPPAIDTTDIIMRDTSTLPFVRFPHRTHTEWLDCTICHDRLFERKAGTTPINMGAILQGKYCGVCHGAVAFPLTECNRCHSVRDVPVARAAPPP